MYKEQKLSNIQNTLGLVIISYVSVALYIKYSLRLNLLQSDALAYWNNSLELANSIDIYHVPGYPFIIFLLRTISFNALPPLAIMIPITFTALIICTIILYKLIDDVTANEALAATGIFFFALWPFTGLTYAIYPLSDLVAIVFFLGGLYSLRKSRIFRASLIFGLAIITHKSMWLFVGSTLIVWVMLNYKFITIQTLWAGLILLAPMAGIWFIGYLQYNSPLWFISSSLSIGMLSHSDLPIFDGAIGSALHRGMFGAAKASIFIILILFCLYTMYISYRMNTAEAWYGFAIALSIFLLCALLKQNEIWAALRFGRLLILPLVWLAAKSQTIMELSYRTKFALVMLVSLIWFASQFAFAYYMAYFFFA